jgi:hypothetical protein
MKIHHLEHPAPRFMGNGPDEACWRLAASVQPIYADELQVSPGDSLVGKARSEARPAEQQELRRLLNALARQQTAQVHAAYTLTGQVWTGMLACM